MATLFGIQGITKRYGARELLSDATISIGEDVKAGFVGRNGVGKSTLFRILLDQEEYDKGQIIKNRELVFGYLEQKDPYKLTETCLEFLERFSGKADWECAKMAGKFQLKGSKLEGPIGSLAGGERMRLKLAAMLLQEPNFLLLDEPTNYLDLRTLLLLEKFLANSRIGFLVISHDREFLMKTCDQTLELENGKLNFFPGDIQAYFEYKELREEQIEKYNENVEAKKKQLQTFVDRFGAKASKAAQARSKAKQIEKLTTIQTSKRSRAARIRLPDPQRTKGILLRLEDANVGYKDKIILTRVDLLLERGVHLAVLGDNGQGKTTLLRTIAQDLAMLGGELKYGEDVKIGYYAQHVYASTADTGNVFEYLERESPKSTPQEILDMAGGFLFSGDDTKKPLSVLSGGERSRLCLASILLRGCDLLLLDEPTNHLDFETVEALAAALNKFKGSVIFVSHDRQFVNQVANQILEVADGKAQLYPGTYEDYVYTLSQRVDEEEAEEKPKNSKKEKNERKMLVAERIRLRSELKRKEEELKDKEREKQEILQLFIDDPSNPHKEKRATLSYIEERIPRVEEEWTQVQARLAELDAILGS